MPDEDELELHESRKAVAAANFATTKTDAAVAAAKTVTRSLDNIIAPNGFTEKFRRILQGST